MSAAHAPNSGPGLGAQSVSRILNSPPVRERLARWPSVDRSYGVPHVSGCSQCGTRVYLDRGLSREVTLELDGQQRTIDLEPFLVCHETTEHAVMKGLGWGYEAAHQVAQAAERRMVTQRLGPGWWGPYQDVVQTHASSAKYDHLPPDLALHSYEADRPWVMAQVRAAQGRDDGKSEKADVDYESVGRPAEHCGPTPRWPRSGQCRHFEPPAACEKVRGAISPRGWCQKWSRLDGTD